MRAVFQSASRPPSYPWRAFFARGLHHEQKAERYKLLRQIYAPFANLDPDSKEYTDLSQSGKVWYDYFQPGDIAPYKALETVRLAQCPTNALPCMTEIYQPTSANRRAP